MTGPENGRADERTETRSTVDEREHARHRKHPGKDSGPNGLKLSDGGWRRKAQNTEKTPPPASVRWSAWLGAVESVENLGSGGGTTILAGYGVDPGVKTNKAVIGDNLALWLAVPQGQMILESTAVLIGANDDGKQSLVLDEVASLEHGRIVAPNDLKLSDRGWPSQGRNSEKTRRPASVRWSAWLGPRL